MDEQTQLKNELKQEIKTELLEILISELQSAAPDELVAMDTITVSERFPDAYQILQPDPVHTHERTANRFHFHCTNGITLQVDVYTDTILRFRYQLPFEDEADFSYAVDPNFQPKAVEVNFSETSSEFEIFTPRLICKINKNNLRVRLKQPNGRVICEDAAGFSARRTILKGLDKISVRKKAPAGESYFGGGDKGCALNLRGEQLENWNTDSFAFGDDAGPLYRSIPFYFGLRRGLGYGIFLDNPYRSFLDFDSKYEGETTLSVAGGTMTYYFIYGPELLDVARQYTDITGRPELPPMWALGFHQSRWSYHPESRVRELANEFRERRIPCDAIYLDIDYMNGYRCFTWNEESFPNPAQLTADLAEQGFQTIVMIDPGIKIDEEYWVFKNGLEQDVFCRRATGKLMIGPVWPQNCVFPDFTNPNVRAWWADLYENLYVKDGISGFWNDMNEPAVFKINHKTFPDEVLHNYDGHPTSHKKAHNIYGLLMSRASLEGLKKLKPEKRPFLLTRATFSGGQRYAAAWTGDNVASWEHLMLANRQCQRMSISGFSFIGTDIGGFVGMPDGELMTRWLQLGIFHPLFRVHSMGNNEDGAGEVDRKRIMELEKINRKDQEPWSFGEEAKVFAREAIELRYRLLPYIYTAFWQYATQGTPMLRSLVFFDQLDGEAVFNEKEFMFGDHLLVSAITEQGVKEQDVYLPKGDWYDYLTNTKFEGEQTITVDTPLDYIPIFVKAGAVVPHYPVQQYTGEFPIEELTLYVFYQNGAETSTLYEDEGEGYAYRQGKYNVKTFETVGTAQKFVLTQKQEGQFSESYTNCRLEFYGIPFAVENARVDDKKVEIQRQDEKLILIVSNTFETVQLAAK